MRKAFLLLRLRGDEFGSLLLRRATNLTNHDDALGLRSQCGGRVGSSWKAAIDLLTVNERGSGRSGSNYALAHLGIRIEVLEAINEIGAVEWIAANADAHRLTEALGGRLIDGFVCERPRA